MPIELVSLDLIDDNPYQTRQRYDEEKIVELAHDIDQKRPVRPETCGLIHIPVARPVRPAGNGEWFLISDELIAQLGGLAGLLDEYPGARFQLAVGHRRRVAFNWLKNHLGPADWGAMPLDITYLTDQSMLNFAWSENDKRDDITAIEKARAIEQATALGMKAVDIATEWGLSESTISNLKRLLHLPEEIQEMVLTRRLDERHARELLPLVQVANVPKQAIKVAKNAAKNNATAQGVAYEVGRIMDRQTTVIDTRLLTWGNWRDASGIPANCVEVCKACEHCRQKGSHLCIRPISYQAKLKAWRDRLLELAQAETGLPANNDTYYTLSPGTFVKAKKKQCSRLAVGLRHTLSDWVQVKDDIPGACYTCLDGYGCECSHSEDDDKAGDPRQAERTRWIKDQNRQAQEIHQQTYNQIEGMFRVALEKLDDRDLALLVCLIKRSFPHNTATAYNLDDLVTAFAKSTVQRAQNRVGQALLQRARVYELCRLNTPLDEVKALIQVIKNVLVEANFSNWDSVNWRVQGNLDRAREILNAHPGHQDLRDQLATLESQIQNFSQEKNKTEATGEKPE